MASDRPKNNLVARVRDNTRKYIEELLRENVRLRAAVDRIGGESKTLRSQLDQLRGDLDRREEQHARLLQLLGAAEEQTRVFEDRFSEVESQNASLAALYAASYQLHATVRKTEVLLAIQEIVINLLGSEELAVFAIEDRGGLRPLVSVGVDGTKLAAVRADGEGLVTRALASKTPEIAVSEIGDPYGLTACIPLVVDEHVLAVIAVFRLLPQKQSLDAFDRELCELLGTHAATALYCAELHDRRGAPE
jgi:nitrate/nitrite-specific signal transduction histidine kinase